VDALGNPLAFHLTPAQHHDIAGADALIPRLQAEALLADRAYDADARVIHRIQAMGKRAIIKPKKNRLHPRPHDKHLYAARHLIENFFCRLKQFRAIATRYDKRATIFLAAIHAAASFIWLV
jgi:transposase